MNDLQREINTLSNLKAKELRERYAELFGEATSANNRAWLLKRIAWRLQAQAEGGLTERALRRAKELAREADVRLTPPKSVAIPSPEPIAPKADPRLPAPGTVLTREYKGATIKVKVLEGGRLEYRGQVYPSLSAVAKAINGSHQSGYAFFGLTGANK